MKRSPFLYNILSFITIALLANSCKKAETDCGSYGGITTPHYYIFWINQDFGCGNITVTMKDANGNDYNSADRTIKVFDAVAPDCSTRMIAATHAVYGLAIGKNYTYKATCSGKVWEGSIRADCEQGGCTPIQLK